MAKDTSLILHASPNFSILLDIYIIDLLALFTICLSREFTTKIGGYLSSDWSHMLFHTRYGTKVTIKSEPLASHHIEPYVSNTINVNYLIFDGIDFQTISEASKKMESIPDILLDERALEAQ